MSGNRASCSIVTTCKGRLAFLRQTLPLMVATGLPVTVVDFDCPDGAGTYVAQHHPTVKVVSLKDQPIFNYSVARNAGARQSGGDWIAFIDSDVMLSERFAAFASTADLAAREFFNGDTADELIGQCLVPRRTFEDVGGYDEAMLGWGVEDVDLFARLAAKGLRRRGFGPGLMSAISHDDAIRLRFTGQDNKWASHRINSLYSQIKRDIEGASRPLTLKERRDLRQMVEKVIGRLRTSGGGALAFSLPLKELFLTPLPDASKEDIESGEYLLSCSIDYKVSLG